jgi:hypothetical protein
MITILPVMAGIVIAITITIVPITGDIVIGVTIATIPVIGTAMEATIIVIPVVDSEQAKRADQP